MRAIPVIILLAATALSGCNGTPSNVNSNGNGNSNSDSAPLKAPAAIRPVDAPDPSFKPCNPYFPLVPGSIAKYVVTYSSGIVADLTVVVDAADENGRKVFTQRSQLIDRSGGMQIIQSTVRTFVCDGDRVQILSEKTDTDVGGKKSSSDFEYRENSLIMTDPNSMLTKGSTWTHAFRIVYHNPGQAPARSDQPIIVAFEVLGPQDVTTAVGTFKTVSIGRKVGEAAIVDYYAPGLGLVKRQSAEGNNWELKEYSGLKPQA